MTGWRPDACPWYGFDDPYVLEILRHVRMAANGMGIQPTALLPLDPPHDVWEGVNHYAHCLALCDADVRERRRQEAERKRKTQRR